MKLTQTPGDDPSREIPTHNYRGPGIPRRVPVGDRIEGLCRSTSGRPGTSGGCLGGRSSRRGRKSSSGFSCPLSPTHPTPNPTHRPFRATRPGLPRPDCQRPGRVGVLIWLDGSSSSSPPSPSSSSLDLLLSRSLVDWTTLVPL